MEDKDKDRQNGHHSLIEVELDPPYRGWIAKCDDNPPWGVWSAFESGSVERFTRAAVGYYDGEGRHHQGLIKSWNFQSSDGELLDPTPEDIDLVPTRAMQMLIQSYGQAFRSLPNVLDANSSSTSTELAPRNRTERRSKHR